VGAEIFTNFWYFVHNFRYRYARSHSRAVKTRILAYFPKNLEPKESPNGLGRKPGQKWLKKAKTPSLVAVRPDNPKPKTKNLFFDFD